MTFANDASPPGRGRVIQPAPAPGRRAPRSGTGAEPTKRKAPDAASGGNGGSGKSLRRGRTKERATGGDNGSSDNEDNESDACSECGFTNFCHRTCTKTKKTG